jgi:hypothetical protein
MFHPIAASCYVDDEAVLDPRRLVHGEMIRLGETSYYRFNHPTEALRLKKLRISSPSTPNVASRSIFSPGQSKLRVEVAKKDEELKQLQLKYQKEQDEKNRQVEAERLSREKSEKQLQEQYQKK